MSSVFPATMTAYRPNPSAPKLFSMVAQVRLRFLISTTTLVSFFFLITTNETAEITKIEIKALKFFIDANTIACVVSEVSLLTLIIVPHYLSGGPVRYFYFFFFCDMLALLFEIAGCAVLTGPWYRGQCRDINSIGLFPMCYRITYSVIASYISVVISLLLIVTGSVVPSL